MILYKNVPGKKPITVENAMFTKDVYNHAKKEPWLYSICGCMVKCSFQENVSNLISFSQDFFSSDISSLEL